MTCAHLSYTMKKFGLFLSLTLVGAMAGTAVADTAKPKAAQAPQAQAAKAKPQQPKKQPTYTSFLMNGMSEAAYELSRSITFAENSIAFNAPLENVVKNTNGALKELKAARKKIQGNQRALISEKLSVKETLALGKLTASFAAQEVRLQKLVSRVQPKVVAANRLNKSKRQTAKQRNIANRYQSIASNLNAENQQLKTSIAVHNRKVASRQKQAAQARKAEAAKKAQRAQAAAEVRQAPAARTAPAAETRASRRAKQRKNGLGIGRGIYSIVAGGMNVVGGAIQAVGGFGKIVLSKSVRQPVLVATLIAASAIATQESIVPKGKQTVLRNAVTYVETVAIPKAEKLTRSARAKASSLTKKVVTKSNQAGNRLSQMTRSKKGEVVRGTPAARSKTTTAKKVKSLKAIAKAKAPVKGRR